MKSHETDPSSHLAMPLGNRVLEAIQIVKDVCTAFPPFFRLSAQGHGGVSVREYKRRMGPEHRRWQSPVIQIQGRLIQGNFGIL